MCKIYWQQPQNLQPALKNLQAGTPNNATRTKHLHANFASLGYKFCVICWKVCGFCNQIFQTGKRICLCNLGLRCIICPFIEPSFTSPVINFTYQGIKPFSDIRYQKLSQNLEMRFFNVQSILKDYYSSKHFRTPFFSIQPLFFKVKKVSFNSNISKKLKKLILCCKCQWLSSLRLGASLCLYTLLIFFKPLMNR